MDGENGLWIASDGQFVSVCGLPDTRYADVWVSDGSSATFLRRGICRKLVARALEILGVSVSGLKKVSQDGIPSSTLQDDQCTRKVERKKIGFIYFIQMSIGGPIKIGWAENIFSRVKELQVGCPHELVVLSKVSSVTRACESQLHRQFRHLHFRGEWFLPAKELLQFISDHTEAV